MEKTASSFQVFSVASRRRSLCDAGRDKSETANKSIDRDYADCTEPGGAAVMIKSHSTERHSDSSQQAAKPVQRRVVNK
jgi:hypothetical protein